jgi:hypothetical protein
MEGAWSDTARGGHRPQGMTGAVSPVARLRRWEESGAPWRVVARASGGVVVALLTCDLGEEVDRFHSADPALLAYIGPRNRSDQPAPEGDG